MSLEVILDDLATAIHKDEDVQSDHLMLFLNRHAEVTRIIQRDFQKFKDAYYSEKLEIWRDLGKQTDRIRDLENELRRMKKEREVVALDVPVPAPPKDKSAMSYVVTKAPTERWVWDPTVKANRHEKRKAGEFAMDPSCKCVVCKHWQDSEIKRVDAELDLKLSQKHTKRVRIEVPHDVIDLTL